MGIFGKLTFWKKKEDLDDFGKEFSKEMPLGGDFTPNSQSFGDSWNAPLDQQPFNPSAPPSFGQNSFGQSSFGQSSPAQNPFGAPPSQSPSQQSFSSPSFSQPSYSQPSFSQPSPNYSQPSYSPPPSTGPDYINSKSLEVISSKLDALRAAIDSMNARLANIERIAGQEDEQRRRRYY